MRWFALCFLIAFSSIILHAQEITVTGSIKDAAYNDPLIGATVTVKGTTKGVITDLDGNFTIKANAGQLLVIAFVGYEEQAFTVKKGMKPLKVVLKESSVLLNEVVAIGYGVQKKKELTGAVSQVKAEELIKAPSSDVTKALQGKVAGLSIVESSGRPGDQANIQIRGLGSINGNSEPLYVVDGIPADGNPNLPAEEVESIDVLKDGAAAAVYGTRAANGVILIKTKRGKAGRTKVDFTAYYGIQNITSETPLMDTEKYLYTYEQVQQMRNAGSHSILLNYDENAIYNNTDFVDAIQNDNAAMQNYNLTVSGGTEGLTYNINANYFNQDGILVQSGYERFSTRANVTFTRGKFSGFVSLGLNHTHKTQEPWGLYQYALYQAPTRPELDTSGGETTIQVTGNNPEHVGFLARLLTNTDTRREDSHNVSANFKYEIIPGLTYQMNLGYNHWGMDRYYFQPKYLVYDREGTLNTLSSREDGILEQYRYSSTKVTMENTLSYNKTFGDHKLGLLAGYTVEETTANTMNGSKSNFISNDVAQFDAGSTLVSLGGNKNENAIVGKLFRVQYTYADKYMLSASGRYDGSSRMSEDNRYAFFPGVSVGWNINEEKFMESTKDWLTNLKLRASYGEVGNENIGNYLYASYVNSNIDYVFGPETNDKLALGAIQRGYSDPDIGWETNISRNIGLDVNLFNGKITATADFYKNDKEDMLLSVMLPPSSGTNQGWGNNSVMSNVGNMQNRGCEFSLSYKGRTKFGMNYTVTGTFTKNKNEITELGDMSSIPLTDSKLGDWTGTGDDIITYMREGYPAGSFFLIETDGIIKTQEELDEVHKYMPTAELGDLKLIDANNDNQINDDDRVYKGSGMPDFETSITFTANWKNFDLSTQLFYSNGNKVFDGGKKFAYGAIRHDDLYNFWSPSNPISNIPAPRAQNLRTNTDYFLSDGDFLRIRNLSIGYTIPKPWLHGVAQWARVYCTAQNLYTFTDYDGFDPEVGGNGVSTRGVDKGNYPITRKFLMGVQVSF